MKKILIIAFTLIVLVGIIFMVYKILNKKSGGNQVKGTKIEYSQVQINKKKIKAEVADTFEERTKGLSGRENLAKNEGMIFVFEKPDIYPFWMKEMKFSIDIIWVNDKKIVEIVKSAPTPESTGQIANFNPKAAADIVLEVNAGFCDKNDIKIGDAVEIK